MRGHILIESLRHAKSQKVGMIECMTCTPGTTRGEEESVSEDIYTYDVPNNFICVMGERLQQLEI